MQYYIHPKRKKTLIQRKDGRTYWKTWVYFRGVLRNENDEKIWSEFTTNKTKNTKFDISWGSKFKPFSGPNSNDNSLILS